MNCLGQRPVGPSVSGAESSFCHPMEKSTLKVKCIIYDCDGVLFDSLEANTRLYNDLCRSVGRPPLTVEEINYAHSHTVYESVHFLFARDEELGKRALETLKQIDFRRYIVYLKMEPNLLKTLDLLRANGIRRAISTNRTTSMNYIMEEFGLWPHFELVVTALDVEHPKPHPESIEKILSTFRLTHNETLFLGDSDIDRGAAKAAGIHFISYKNEEITTGTVIHDHLELLNLIECPKKR